MCNISFLPPLHTGSFLILLRPILSSWSSEWKWMKMDWTISERWTNGERNVNALWMHSERTVSALWTVSANGAESASERTVSARWTHKKNGKVERFRDCNYQLKHWNLISIFNPQTEVRTIQRLKLWNGISIFNIEREVIKI